MTHTYPYGMEGGYCGGHVRRHRTGWNSTLAGGMYAGRGASERLAMGFAEPGPCAPLCAGRAPLWRPKQQELGPMLRTCCGFMKPLREARGPVSPLGALLV